MTRNSIPGDPEGLFAHSDWVRELARRLVIDDARADDVVQQTWVAALENPPEKPSAVRSWLGVVVRNFARLSYREESRRGAREALARPRGESPSVETALQKLELQQAVLDAVQDLSSPYRETILLRYFHDLSPTEIARRSDCSVDSVKTRLRRGKDLLRTRLDGTYGGRSWCLVLAAPLADGTRKSVGATSAAAPSVSVGAAKTIAFGGLIMSTKTLLFSVGTVALLAVCAGLYVADEQAEGALLRQQEEDQQQLANELATAQRQIDELRAEVAEAHSSRDDVEAQLRATREELELRSEVVAAQPAIVRAVETPSRQGRQQAHPSVLAEADQVAQELAAKGDIEGLWELAADLLTLGEDGYKKVVEHAKLLDRGQVGGEMYRTLWRSEEQIAGRFLNVVGDHAEELLRFGLYVQTLDQGSLPKVIEDFSDKLIHEFGVVLLGYYDGEDAELLNEYVELFRPQLMGDKEHRRATDMVRALGQIPTEEATDLLLDVIEGKPNLRGAAVPSLAWQRSDRALPVLRELLTETTDSRLRTVISAAIQFLD